MKHFLSPLLLIVIPTLLTGQSLSGRKICIDPGHGGYNAGNDRHIIPDPGTDFWESESNFRKALWLRTLLQSQGATVLLTRETNDYPNPPDAEPSLTARWTFANQNGADWFHSIHSNATSLPLGANTATNYTCVLLKEDIATRQPVWPQAVTMSTYVYQHIRAKIRTGSSSGNITGVAGVYKDYTFYGGTSGGFNLGVLNGLAMPGELSEGSFHDNYAETRRLMNNSYRKMEAYALRDAFMQYYGVPADTMGIVAGILTDDGLQTPIDGVQLRLLPENRTYLGDSYHNGFYMFDSLAPGSHSLVFERPNYPNDTVAFTISPGQIRFLDRTIGSTIPPRVLSSSPTAGANILANAFLTLTFSQRMNRSTSEPNVVLIGPGNQPVGCSLLWSNGDRSLKLTPLAPLVMDTAYALVIRGMATDVYSQAFDGNGDGSGGDSLAIPFRTIISDITAPQWTFRDPDTAQTAVRPNQFINITYNERLNPTSITSSSVAMRMVGGSLVSKTQYYVDGASRGAVNIYPSAALQPGKSYRVRLNDVADLSANIVPSTLAADWTFTVDTVSYVTSTIDNFDAGIGQWTGPTASPTGVNSVQFSASAARLVPVIPGNISAARWQFIWTADSGLVTDTLIMGPSRIKAVPAAGSAVQAYVFGGAGLEQLRFLIEDSVEAFPEGRMENQEAGPWVTVDWWGWRLVEWAIDKQPASPDFGNGHVEGSIRLRGIQIRNNPGVSADTGELIIDQIQFSALTPATLVSDPAATIPSEYALLQNYPNPFNPETVISYSVAGERGHTSTVTLAVYDLLGREVAVLVDAQQTPGIYSIRFDASSLSSGVYLYRMQCGSFREVRSMLLMK